MELNLQNSFRSNTSSDCCLQGKSLHNNFVWALLGNVVFAATHWGMIALLARITSPSHVGHFALSLAVCSPIAMFSNLQLRALLASDAESEFHIKDYLSMMVLMSPIGLAAIGCVVWGGGFGAEASLAVLLMGIAKNIESFSNICYGALQRNKRLDLVGKSLLIKGPASLLALGLLVWATQSIAMGIAGIILVWFVLLVIYDSANVSEMKKEFICLQSMNAWDFIKLKKLFKLGFPLAISTFLLAFTVSVPNLLIGRLLNETAVGVFAALASLSWAGVPVINALGQVLLPRLGECYVAGDRYRMRRLVLGTSFGGLILGVVGIFGAWGLGTRIIAYVYGTDYLGHNNLLMWLMGAACLLYASRFLADALTAMRCARALLIVQSLTVIMVILGGYWTILLAGLEGMAKVLALSLAVRALLLLSLFWLITSQRYSTKEISTASVISAQPRSRAA
jgi:O-antigen/teichoic acid export membrane protein